MVLVSRTSGTVPTPLEPVTGVLHVVILGELNRSLCDWHLGNLHKARKMTNITSGVMVHLVSGIDT